jgi:hypothetical protein
MDRAGIELVIWFSPSANVYVEYRRRSACQRLLAGIVVSNPAGTRLFDMGVLCISFWVGLVPRREEFY